jgi:anti-sigma regulatory factor (Ser/Thr protein kinase)
MAEWMLPRAEVELWQTAQLTLRRVRRRGVPRRVRRFASDVLSFRVDEDTVWKATQILDELIINVVTNTPKAVAVVRINVRPGRVALTVQDDGPGAIPWPLHMADEDAEGGRGLPIVFMLADRVQIFDVSPAGKALTALIDY